MKLSPSLFTPIFLSLLMASSLQASPYGAKVSEEELQALMIEADTNSDEKIDFDEYYHFTETQKKKQVEEQLDRSFAQCDKNQDNLIGLDDLEQEAKESPNQHPDADSCRFPEDAFALYDLDEDGKVSKEEILKVLGEGSRPRRSTLKKQQKLADERQSKVMEEHFSSCDSDGDSLLSLRELVSMNCNRIHMFTEKFDAQDQNQDNYLSLEELKTPQAVIERSKTFRASMRKTESDLDQFTRLQMTITRCDDNDDGNLAKQETINEGCEIDMSYFDSVDYNQDDIIDYKEVDRVRLKQRFEQIDKDKSNYLEKEEFSKIAAMMVRRYSR